MGLFDFIRSFNRGKRNVSVSCGGGVIGNDLEHETPRIDGLDYLNKDNVDLKKLFSYLSKRDLVAKHVDDRRVSLSIKLSVSEERYLEYSYVFFNNSKQGDVRITAFKNLYEKNPSGEDRLIDGFSKTVSKEILEGFGYDFKLDYERGLKYVIMSFNTSALMLYCGMLDLKIYKMYYNHVTIFDLLKGSERNHSETGTSYTKTEPSGGLKNTSVFGN